MGTLNIGTGESLVIDDGEKLVTNSLTNLGNVSGGGILGIDWASAITGTPEAVDCQIEEENVPSMDVSITPSRTSILASVSDCGLVAYVAVLDNGEQQTIPASREISFNGLSAGSAHCLLVTATNSRNQTLSAKFYFSTACDVVETGDPKLFAVVEDVYSQMPLENCQNYAFTARITDAKTGTHLSRAMVDSITLNVFRLTKNVSGNEKEAVTGFIDKTIPGSAILDSVVNNAYWRRDSVGYNFCHIPDQKDFYLCPNPGAYSVEYEIKLLGDQNPIKVIYSLVAF